MQDIVWLLVLCSCGEKNVLGVFTFDIFDVKHERNFSRAQIPEWNTSWGFCRRVLLYQVLCVIVETVSRKKRKIHWTFNLLTIIGYLFKNLIDFLNYDRSRYITHDGKRSMNSSWRKSIIVVCTNYNLAWRSWSLLQSVEQLLSLKNLLVLLVEWTWRFLLLSFFWWWWLLLLFLNILFYVWFLWCCLRVNNRLVREREWLLECYCLFQWITRF